MLIGEFDMVDAGTARELLLSCADVPRWADELVAARPYADRDALLAAATHLAATWTDAEVDAALADHPRIGERHRGEGQSAASSRSEQSGVDGSDADVAARLLRGNQAYEARFDRIFLVRAAGRDAEEILALLEERLGNDPAAERAVVSQQLGEIALLRLGEKVVA